MENEEQSIRTWSGDYRYPKSGGARRYLISALIGIVLFYVMFFVKLPYFVFMPGTAEAVKPMVAMEAAPDEEKGAFLLTTVRVADANIANYLLALVHPYEELQLKRSVLHEGESEQEYTQRQEYVMLTSQASAMEAAYKKAGISYHISHEGVMVMQTLAGMPAEAMLKPGDILLKVDDIAVSEAQALIDYVKPKQAGDSVRITFKRGAAELTETLQLGLLPQQEGETGERRSGLGIVPANMQQIKADQPDKQVSIKAGEIGGPSAGLMFSLEIYNQLVQGDMTKGYRIAGTGTIEADGTVGVIGGIQHKVIAADKEGAEIFFAPKDITLEDGSRIANYSTAAERARQIHSDMKVVEVATMDDALKYLASLPEKR